MSAMATLLSVAEEKLSPASVAFHSARASELVARLREPSVRSRTRNVAWREEQLRALIQTLEECEGKITESLKADLGKPSIESWASEVTSSRGRDSGRGRHVTFRGRTTWLHIMQHYIVVGK